MFRGVSSPLRLEVQVLDQRRAGCQLPVDELLELGGRTAGRDGTALLEQGLADLRVLQGRIDVAIENNALKDSKASLNLTQHFPPATITHYKDPPKRVLKSSQINRLLASR